MKIDIDYTASLANIPLTDEEKSMFKPQLEEILTFVEKLNEVDTSKIQPTFQVTGKVNELRDDIAYKGLSTNKAIQNASEKDESFIVTRGVFTDG